MKKRHLVNVGKTNPKRTQTNPIKANFQKAKMNVNKVLTKDYENMSNWAICENKPNTNPNKANLLKAKMNVNFYSTKDYENISNWTLFENKPNTNPIKPNPPAPKIYYGPYDVNPANADIVNIFDALAGLWLKTNDVPVPLKLWYDVKGNYSNANC